MSKIKLKPLFDEPEKETNENMKPWTLQERESAQNSNFRQDVLCMYLSKPVIQETRESGPVKLPSIWFGHSCVGDVSFKSLDAARQFAKEMGYNGILL